MRYLVLLVVLALAVGAGSAQYAPTLLAPYTPERVQRLVVFVQPEATYPPQVYPQYYAKSGEYGVVATAVYGIDRLRANLTDDDPWLKRGAWAAHRTGDTWKLFSTPPSMYKDARTPDAGQVDKVLAALFDVRNVGAVYWSAATHFVPAPGDCGMAKPHAELALLMDDGSVRWVILGTVARDSGLYAFVFKALDVGADGQPHPMGLFKLDNAARLYELLVTQ